MNTKEDILQIIEEEDVEFIRLQFTDINGNLKNLAITPGQLDKALNNNYCFEGSAIFNHEYTYPDSLYLRPDLDTFAIIPWRPQQSRVAKMFCDVYTEEGEPFLLNSRKILKNVLHQAKEKGYSFMVNPENEFFLFNTDQNGLPTTTSHENAGYMDVGPTDFGENARRDIVLMLEEMDFNVESSHHEHAPAQHGIDFGENEALRTADAMQNFRFAVRSVAKRFGLHATFMPKPKNDVAGSGLHVNFVMLKDDKNIFRTSDGKPSEAAYYFIGGLLKHGKALTAIGNPIVNSYKRLVSGFEAPSRINWSSRRAQSFVRLKKNCGDVKVEIRFPDGASNPYLLLAACIAAGMEGIAEQIDPGEDCFGKEPTSFPKVPGGLRSAIESFSSDPLMAETFGQEFVDIYSEIKISEWDEYALAVSDWELNRYLTRV